MTTYILIDALDECVIDTSRLLSFIAMQSSMSHRVKWIVSSRNWQEIEVELNEAGDQTRLSLEINAKSITAAVRIYIKQKVDHLARKNQYKDELRQAVIQHLTINANDTLLWVALVCQGLQRLLNGTYARIWTHFQLD